MNKFVIIVASIIAISILLRVSIGFLSTSRVATGLITASDGTTTLAGCDGLQNCTASTASAKRNHIEPISYTGDASEVIDNVASLVPTMSGTKIIAQTENYLHVTYKTLLLGYTDDLELLRDDEQGMLQIRSASRLGRSDFGANRKRIEALRMVLKGKI